MSPSSTPSCRAAAITRFTAASVLEVAASKLASRVSTPNMIVRRLGTTLTSASPVTLMVCCSDIDCAEQKEASKTKENAMGRIDFTSEARYSGDLRGGPLASSAHNLQTNLCA